MRAIQARLLVCLVLPGPTFGQTAASDLTAQERALCRPDSIRLCVCNIGWTAALRDNRAPFSAPCLTLLQSRGN